MRNTTANRIALSSAIVAGIITIVVVGVFLRRSWQAREAEKHAPPPVPEAVEKASQIYQFSKVDGTRTLWTVRASNATQYKDSGRILLSDVWITIYGKKGDRSDNIHTQSCDYFASESKLVCSGEVQIDLESSEDVHRAAAAPSVSPVDTHIIHISTRGVTFDRNSGDASTDQAVKFSFPAGEGSAVGARYNSAEGAFEMRRDVHISLTPSTSRALANKGTAATNARSPIIVEGSSLDFRHETRTMQLRGPVVARQVAPADARHSESTREMHAGLVTVKLDEKLHARRVTIDGNPGARAEVHYVGAKGNGVLTADQFVADLAPEGSVDNFSALGNVQGEYKSPAETDHISANRIVAEMVPKINQPRVISATGAVKIDASRGTKGKKIETASLVLDFVPGPAPLPGKRASYRPSQVRSLSPATITWNEPVQSKGKTVESVTRVMGQQLEATFDEHKKIRKILAHNGTQLDRDLTGRPHENSTAQEMSVDFDAAGQWSTMDLSGNVHMKEGDRSAQANRAHAEQSTSIMTLTGSAEASDTATRTTADSIIFNQQSDDMRADGRVLTTYQKTDSKTPANSGMGVSLNLGPDPSHITSDHLTGNSNTGKALYTGHARLWQGDSTLEADEIELNRTARQLDARGNVRAVFQAVAASQASSASGAPQTPRVANTSAPATPPRPELWRVRSETLTYWDEQNKAHLERGFTAESSRTAIAGRSGDLFFKPSNSGATGNTQRLDHAIAIGNVTVRKDDTRGTGERGEYDAVAGKFVLSGGNPTIYDTSGNSTRGRQLTFFLADDTILVESEQGTRTLTRHQVEKKK
jgi:lipopolysaccharide export system protein LptA/lipopolysaccharide export system protein LptC